MPGERSVIRVLFAAGAGLVIAAFTYSLVHSWPSFDPIASATLIGIGLLLVVIYDRLGAILRVLQRLVSIAEEHAPEREVRSPSRPPDAQSGR